VDIGEDASAVAVIGEETRHGKQGRAGLASRARTACVSRYSSRGPSCPATRDGMPIPRHRGDRMLVRSYAIQHMNRSAAACRPDRGYTTS